MTIQDTLDARVTYTAGTAQVSYDNGGTWAPITPSGTSPLTFSLTDLSPGATYILIYDVKVTAKNSIKLVRSDSTSNELSVVEAPGKIRPTT